MDVFDVVLVVLRAALTPLFHLHMSHTANSHKTTTQNILKLEKKTWKNKPYVHSFLTVIPVTGAFGSLLPMHTCNPPFFSASWHRYHRFPATCAAPSPQSLPALYEKQDDRLFGMHALYLRLGEIKFTDVY